MQVIGYYDKTIEHGLFDIGRKTYKVHGKRILAKNHYDAQVQWYKKYLEDTNVCHGCSETIDAGPVVEAGKFYMYHDTCLPKDCILLPNCLEEIIKGIHVVMTVYGKKYAYNLSVPDWFWNIDRDDRPAWANLWKAHGKTMLSIWGKTREEVLARWFLLCEMR